jgi:O-antigen/teichoic acid export membrane protein
MSDAVAQRGAGPGATSLPRLVVPQARPGRRSAIALTIGTLSSGVLAYAFNAVAARSLGPEAYGPVAVLWAALFLVSVVLFRPIEQTLSRGISERLARGEDARQVLRSTLRLAGSIAAAAAAVIALGWSWITEQLFDGQEVLTAAFVVGTAGYAVSFTVRGISSGLRWLSGYGLLLFADGALRLLLVLPIVLVASPAIAAAALAGAAVGGALAPLAYRSWRARTRRSVPLLAQLRGRPAPAFDLRHALGFAAPAVVIAAADQVLVSGGALLVAIGGGPGAAAAAGTVFAATMLVRAPVFLFQGFAAALLPSLTASQARGADVAFRRRVLRAAGVLLAFAAALVAGTAIAGPESMRVLYGPGFAVDRMDLTLLAAGVGFYLAGATLSQAVLARNMAGTAACVWSAGAVMFVVLELALPGGALERVSGAFTAAAALIAFLLLINVLRPSAARVRPINHRLRQGEVAPCPD